MNGDRIMAVGRDVTQRAVRVGRRQYLRALGRAVELVAPDGVVGGMSGLMARLPLTPEHVLLGYTQGMFPMEHGGRIDWQCPEPRAVLPLDLLHIPSRDRTYLRKGLFDFRFDTDPDGVMQACADRSQTWLTTRVQTVYRQLWEIEAMHTVEAWQDGRLVGGAFGVAVGTVFTVDSMFSRANHASKLAFAHLCQRLGEWEFDVVDCQYLKPHFGRFGAIEIPREEYRRVIARGLAVRAPSFGERDRTQPSVTPMARPDRR